MEDLSALKAKIARMQKELETVKNVVAFAGWVDADSVKKAKINEFGANLPGGQPYFFDKKGNMVFMSKSGPMNSKGRRKGSFGVTKPCRIPPRPTLRMTRSFNNAKWQQLAGNAANEIIEGKGTVRQNFLKLAAVMAQDIQETMINPGNYTPNSPLTVKRKGKNTPMRDSDTLLRSVVFAVKSRREVEGNVV